MRTAQEIYNDYPRGLIMANIKSAEKRGDTNPVWVELKEIIEDARRAI